VSTVTDHEQLMLQMHLAWGSLQSAREVLAAELERVHGGGVLQASAVSTLREIAANVAEIGRLCEPARRGDADSVRV